MDTAVEAPQACSVCHNLKYCAERPRRQPRKYKVILSEVDINQRKIEDFRISGEHGCPICAFLVKAVLHFEVDPESHELFYLNISPHRRADLLFPSSASSVQIFTPIGYPPALNVPSGHGLSSHGDADEAYDFIQQCLARCQDDHQACHHAVNYAPTRLIDVGMQQGAEVRLIESAQLPRTPSYLALSYCWGRTEVVVTTASNYEAMKREIQLSCLPQTVQDAIKITRRVGLQYIWIDALCIIQDSVSDWEVESSEMAAVYQSAYFTIAAATSEAAAQGFLHHRHAVSQQKAPLLESWTYAPNQETVLGARLAPVLASHTLLGGDPDGGDHLPLWNRGWTLQEYILSTRVLIYSKEELWWSCQSGLACECMTLDVMVENSPTIQFTPVHTLATPERAFKYWHDSVGEYMDRALTKSEDRLPGISGIARVIQDITKSKYIAGLWSDNFIHDLTWEAVTLGEVIPEIPTPSYYRAPSFSWVSLDQRATYSAISWKSASSCSVIHVESHVPGFNPLGQVTDASATLQGLLCKATLGIELRPGELEFYFVAIGERRVRATVDVPVELFEAINEEGIPEKCTRRAQPGQPWRRPDSGVPVFLLYLGRWYQGLPYNRTNRQMIDHAYLLLGKSPKNANRYERLGIVTDHFSMDPDPLEPTGPLEKLEALVDFSEAVITIE
ncbi:heterokaryon incompatibility protein-domain-containing protein [Aspergillus varians]